MSGHAHPAPSAASVLSELPSTLQPPLPTPRHAGWNAQLSCTFALRGERTVLARRMHKGPLLVQRPFYPEGPSPCHLYLIHPPGGVAGGDTLTLEATLSAGASAVLTTPAATKLYRSAGRASSVANRFTLANGALLEWLPQETLVFSDADGALSTRVDLQGDAQFIGWEVVGLGRPASGERFDLGRLRQRFEVYRDDVPLFLERTVLDGDEDVLHAPWGLAGQPVFATMVMTTDAPAAHVQYVRERLQVSAPGRFAITALSGAIVCRYIGPWAESARSYLCEVWRLLRQRLTGRNAVLPRIWAT